MAKEYVFKFVPGPKRYGKQGSYTNEKGLSDAIARGYMNKGDRGTLAVCLFELHDTPHYENAENIRKNIESRVLLISWVIF